MKKIKNFFYYEWKKLLLVILAACLVVVTVKQCAAKVQTDLGVLYVNNINPGDITPLAENIKGLSAIKDTDSDGEVTVKTRTILISSDDAINMEQQVPQQIQFEIISGENMLFIVNEDTLKTYAAELSFADIGDVTNKLGIPEEKCRTYSDGKVYAVSLEDNSLLSSLGINTENMFIAQRNYLPKDKNSPLNINAKTALEYIIKE